MQCRRCGATLQLGASFCGECGALASAGGTTRPNRPPAGVPTEPYAASSYGPPVNVDAHVPVVEPPPGTIPIRPIGYRPIIPPPPPPARRRGGCIRPALLTLSLALALAVALIAVTGALSAHPWQWRLPGQAGTTPHATSTRTATTGPACTALPVDKTAASMLRQPQLTTGLRDRVAHDYRPLNNVHSFAVGQEGFVTFEIASAQAGTAGVRFCTPQGMLNGQVGVPAGSAGHFGEFSTRFSSADAGSGIVTLMWNGKVAANLPFTVRQ